MAQKPMLRAEVYAHAMRASQNRKKEVRREKVASVSFGFGFVLVRVRVLDYKACASIVLYARCKYVVLNNSQQPGHILESKYKLRFKVFASVLCVHSLKN